MDKILITGASTGIGATYAERLARRGHGLVLVARDAVRLEALAARLRGEAGVHVEVLAADLTAKADLLRIERRLREDATIDGLVNNAGVASLGPIAGGDPDRLEAMVELNVLAMTRLAAAAATAFAARKRGTIINIGSVLGLAPERTNAVYAGSKAFVLAFTQSLNQEIGASGVRVQAVLPGATRTDIWEKAGRPVASLPPEMVMEVAEMVDAALAGFDAGELVTIPSLPDPADWAALEEARLRLGPNLSRSQAAGRFKVAA